MNRPLLAACLLFVFIGTTVSAGAEEATVRLKWFNQAQFAGFYIAKDKGFYESEGLEVSIQPGGPDFPAVQMVAGGNEQFGVTGADQILVARGKGVPVVAVAVLYRKSPFVLFSLKQSGIEKPEQFRGHKVGVKLGGNEELIYRAVLAKSGASAKDLTEIPVKFDLTPLLSGQVDVWPGYVINEVITAREKAFDVNVIWPSDYGVNLYADTVFTTEKMLKERPQAVRKFVAATLKGWSYAVAHPDEAAQVTVKFGNKLDYAHELAMMRASIPLIKAGGDAIGVSRPSEWEGLQAMLVEAGFQKAKVDVTQAFTNAELP